MFARFAPTFRLYRPDMTLLGGEDLAAAKHVIHTSHGGQVRFCFCSIAHLLVLREIVAMNATARRSPNNLSAAWASEIPLLRSQGISRGRMRTCLIVRLTDVLHTLTITGRDITIVSLLVSRRF